MRNRIIGTYIRNVLSRQLDRQRGSLDEVSGFLASVADASRIGSVFLMDAEQEEMPLVQSYPALQFRSDFSVLDGGHVLG